MQTGHAYSNRWSALNTRQTGWPRPAPAAAARSPAPGGSCSQRCGGGSAGPAGAVDWSVWRPDPARTAPAGDLGRVEQMLQAPMPHQSLPRRAACRDSSCAELWRGQTRSGIMLLTSDQPAPCLLHPHCAAPVSPGLQAVRTCLPFAAAQMLAPWQLVDDQHCALLQAGTGTAGRAAGRLRHAAALVVGSLIACFCMEDSGEAAAMAAG